MNEGKHEDVAVHVPGLSRPPYGEVIAARQGETVTVHAFRDGTGGHDNDRRRPGDPWRAGR